MSELMGDVLVVDDDLALLRAMDRMLRGFGYDTFATSDASYALDILRTRRFSLLVLDVQMPLLNGLELARYLREGGAGDLNREIPIMFVTADESAATYEGTYDVDAIRYLPKPVRPDVLERAIDNILHV